MTAYRDEFEVLALHHGQLAEEVLIDMFVDGLEDKIRVKLLLYDQDTLIGVMDKATYIEEKNRVMVEGVWGSGLKTQPTKELGTSFTKSIRTPGWTTTFTTEINPSKAQSNTSRTANTERNQTTSPTSTLVSEQRLIPLHLPQASRNRRCI